MMVNKIWTNWVSPAQVRSENPKHPKTVTVTKGIRHDQDEFSLTIIKPTPSCYATYPIPAFLFVAPQPSALICPGTHEKIVTELVAASGQAALMVQSSGHSPHLPVFEMFAAMKWAASRGKDIGIDGSKIAIVGTQLGANAAAVLSLMALQDACPAVSVQILIDPHFYVSEKQVSSSSRRPGYYGFPENDRDWVSMRGIYNLPFDSKINVLSGLPPTLIQLSENAGNHCEVEYYYARLLHAGIDVTYVNYDDSGQDAYGQPAYFSESLLRHAAAELRKFV